MVNVPQSCNENWCKLIATGKVQVNLKRKYFKKDTADEKSKIWFDDVDEILIEGSKTNSNQFDCKILDKKNYNLSFTRSNKRTHTDTGKLDKRGIKRLKSDFKKNNSTIKLENKMLKQESKQFQNVQSKNSKRKFKKNVETLLHDANENLADDNLCQNNKLTKYLSLDCEMVGTGYLGSDNMLARVSVVNQYGQTLMDKFVRPREKVTDYRTAVSGITPQLINNGEDFLLVQKEVCDILKDRILVGHAVHHDLKVLFLSHPRSDIRDTSKYKPFRQIFSGSTPSLKKLAKHVLKVDIQDGQHNSVEDAAAAMSIYLLHRKKWEASLKRRH